MSWKTLKKRAENWFTIAFFSSCPGADYAVVKLRNKRTSWCDFHFAARLHPHAIPAFFIFQQIRLLGHSVKADSQWESITRHHLKSPWRPVALWCEQRCLVTHLKRAAIRRCWATLWPTPRLQWPLWLQLFSIVPRASLEPVNQSLSCNCWCCTDSITYRWLLCCMRARLRGRADDLSIYLETSHFYLLCGICAYFHYFLITEGNRTK